MAAMRILLVILLLLGLAAAGVHFLGGGLLSPDAGGGGGKPQALPAPEQGEAAKVPLPTNPEILIDRIRPRKPEENPLDRPRVTYPDGTVLPTLNGVEESFGSIKWPANRPYSPVIGIWHDSTREWYVHEDGCRSTTFYPEEVIRNGKVVKEAVALVQAPAVAVPDTRFIRGDGKSPKLPVER